MSVPQFGRVTPLQSDMLNIGGVLSGVPEEFVKENDRIEAMKKARANLVRQTGKDFGYDLAQWHQFLLHSEQHREEYTFHYAWKAVSNKIEALLEDAGRLRLAASADQTGDFGR